MHDTKHLTIYHLRGRQFRPIKTMDIVFNSFWKYYSNRNIIWTLLQIHFRIEIVFCVTDLGVKTSRHGGSGSGEHQRSGQIIPHIATLSSSQNVTPPPVFSEPPAGPADSVTEAQPKTQHGENFTFHQKHTMFRSSDLYLDELKKWIKNPEYFYWWFIIRS